MIKRESINQEEQNSQQIITFSEDKKSPTIQLLDDNQTATQTTRTTKRFALVNKNLNQEGDQFIVFKIQNLKGWIGIGMALESSIIEKDFNVHGFQSGHGSWMVASNGYIWNVSNQDQNEKQCEFKIQNQDIIIMKYSPNQQKLILFNQTTNSNKIEVSVELEDQSQIISPCVCLASNQDSVSLLQWDNSYMF